MTIREAILEVSREGRPYSKMRMYEEVSKLETTMEDFSDFIKVFNTLTFEGYIRSFDSSTWIGIYTF